MALAEQRDLILRIREGDSPAIVVFYELLQKAATPVARRFQDPDVGNEIFLKFLAGNWRQLNNWKGEGPLENWIAVIARRTAIAKLKNSRCEIGPPPR